jgi:general stress protein 26
MKKDLTSKDALEKYKKIAEEVNICMMITSPDSDESSRPMATIRVDDDGTTWFYTHKSSAKISELNHEKAVHLVYAHPGKDSYMDVWASGEIVEDRGKIRELWKPIIKAWFPNGVDDPDLCLLKINPSSAYYWDSETGKMIEFGKMIASVVTGKRLAEGVEGNLNVDA